MSGDMIIGGWRERQSHHQRQHRKRNAMPASIKFNVCCCGAHPGRPCYPENCAMNSPVPMNPTFQKRAREVAAKINRDGIEGHGPYRQACLNSKGIELIAKAIEDAVMDVL